MRIAVYFDLRNPPQWRRDWHEHYGRTLELIQAAEHLGADSVVLSEHHFFEDGYLPQPLTFAAAIAARTSRLRIGTAVMLLPSRHPVHLAEEAAVVDVMSNGRLDLGFGTGYRVPELERFGVPMADRYRVFEDHVRQLRALWSSGDITPPPIQDPMPLWGGFTGPRGAALAGRLGLGLLVVHAHPNVLAAYRRGLEEGGHAPTAARFKVGVEMILADDPDEAWPRIAPHVSYQRNSYRRYAVAGTNHPVPDDLPPERDGGPHLPFASLSSSKDPTRDLALSRVPVLTVDEAVQYVHAKVGACPAEEIWCWGTIAGMPDDLAERNVELLCRELAPRLRDLGGSPR